MGASACFEKKEKIVTDQDIHSAAEELCTLSVVQLKQFIASRGLTHDDCVEKADLIRRAHEARAKTSRPVDPAVDRFWAMELDALKDLVVSAGLQWADCRDKEGLVQRALKAKDRLDTRYQYKRGDGNAEALAIGTHVYNSARGGHVDNNLLRKIGGKEAFKHLFDRHYQNMFADPRMAVLFGWRAKELPTKEHGRRLATFILHFNGLDDEYGRTPHDGFQSAHQHAKRCPMRPKEHRNAVAFTIQQRNAWLGHLSLACDAKDVPFDCKNNLLGWLRGKMGFYGPFIEE